jgi:hypothetical protein
VAGITEYVSFGEILGQYLRRPRLLKGRVNVHDYLLSVMLFMIGSVMFFFSLF